MRKKAFVFDIDGTLALRGERSPYNHARLGEDTVNAPVRECLRALRAKGFSILLFSGRDERWRKDTIGWLKLQDIFADAGDFDLLLMRPEGGFWWTGGVGRRTTYVMSKRESDMTTTGTTQIIKILFNRYGVGPFGADTPTALWAAARCENPEAEIRALNRLRAKHGKPPIIIPHGYAFAAVA